jgi:hypothetical protein
LPNLGFSDADHIPILPYLANYFVWIVGLCKARAGFPVETATWIASECAVIRPEAMAGAEITSHKPISRDCPHFFFEVGFNVIQDQRAKYQVACVYCGTLCSRAQDHQSSATQVRLLF